jgi:hypothetical protein
MHIHISHSKVEIIKIASINQIGLIDKVPVCLERVALAFNRISKRGAFGERMVVFTFGDRSVVGLEHFKFADGGSERVGCLSFQNLFSHVGNYKQAKSNALGFRAFRDSIISHL